MSRDQELERRRRVGAGPAVTPAVPTPGKHTRAQRLGMGTPLPPQLRAKYEASLGRDLSAVRVHTDAAAAEIADEHNARAAAIGQDIVFAPGEYDPDRPESQQLLAHEVAHVAQQNDRAPADAEAIHALPTTEPGDVAERDADAAARAMVMGQRAGVSAQPIAIARKTRDESRETFEPPAAASEPAAEPVGEPAASAEAPAADATLDDAKTTQPAVAGDLVAERVGVSGDETPDQPMAMHDTEAGKADLAAQGEAMPPQGGADELAGKPPAAADTGAGADAAPIDVGAVSPEIAASIEQAQNDTRDAVAQAQTEATAFKTDMAQRRDAFDAEQRAMSLEQLKTMSPADKRATLRDMGFDEKSVKKMKDAELDRIITGKIETEQRQTRIMGMTPDELAALPAERKIQHLVDLGVDRGDLDKIGRDRAAKAFDDVMALAHVPGEHTVKIKIKGGLFGKSWIVNIKCDAEGNSDMSAKEEGGFFSKLWGWIKAALPIILTVLAPLTAGATLIALAIYQAAVAIQSGNWLGAIVAGAGAIVGIGAFMAAKGALGAASTFGKLAQVAGKVKTVAEAAQGAMAAAKAKNAGSLLGALASGAAAFAKFSAGAADKLAQTMNRWSDRLKKWGAIVGGGETVARGIKGGDPIAAVGGAFDTVASVVDPKGESNAGKNLARAGTITTFVGAGKQALSGNPPNYGAVAEAAMGIAGVLKTDRRLEDATRIIGAATRLKTAWDNRAADPGALAQAAFDVASSIQIAKYDAQDNKAGDGTTGDKEADRAVYVLRYERAGRIVSAAGKAITAASAKPRPNYLAALEAGNELIAQLSDNNRLAQALALTTTLGQWTAAVNSGDERAIVAAGIAFGETINTVRGTIAEDRAAAKQGANKDLPEGTTATDDGLADDVPEFDAGDAAGSGFDFYSDMDADVDGELDPDDPTAAQTQTCAGGGKAKAKTPDRGWSPEPMTTPAATVTALDGPTVFKNFPFSGTVVDAEVWFATYSDGSKVQIAAPKSPTPGYHNHTVKEVADAAGFMPKSARMQITRIQLNPIANPDDAYWATQYKVPDFHSYMTAGAAGVVTIYPDKVSKPVPDATGERSALVHETGHTWSYRTWGQDTTKGKWLDWQKAMTADGTEVSGYAKSSIVEDVAETIRVYVSSKGTPRFATWEQKVPNRFAILKREYDK